MQLTKMEKLQLTKATEDLGEAPQKIILQLLIELSESYSWFKKYLLAAVNHGNTFVPRKNDTAEYFLAYHSKREKKFLLIR